MQELTIYGEGKGGGHTPTESKDTLKSQQTMRLLFALSEGEIDSVSDILVNSASISNYDSKVVTWETRTGTLDQTIIKGFSDVEAPIAGAGTLPVELKYNVEKIYTLLGQYDAGRVTLSIDRLEKVTDQGDRVGYEVSLDIYKRRKLANGTTENWQLASEITKKGKCTNVYAWDVRVDKPAGTLFADSWEIKIVRTSADDATDKLMSKTFLSNIITITEKTLTYPKTALVGVTIYDAKSFGTSIPELKFKVKGMKFLLPSNYTASSRNYNESTPWNGSFKSYAEYTDNLAWVIYWVLRDSNWGLGIPAADIDLGSFYTYAKHCDELVPAGNTTEPRYTVHLQCIDRENVPTFLMRLLTLGNANFSSNDFGQVKVVWDGAGQAITKVVSNATVIDGMFDYTSNDLEGRTNLVNVTYAREDFFGDSDTVTHYEDSLITRYGLQTSDVILLGCKSEYQALRKARWTLYNNCYSGDLVTFKQLFQGAHYQIGELVSVMDSDNVSSNAKHAIIKSASVAGGLVTAILDREIILANATYEIEFVGTDGLTFSSKAINQTNGTFSTITYAGTDTPFVSGTVLFKTAALTPRVIKVIKIDKDDSNVYTITGLTHHEDKYNYIDSTGTIVKPSSSGSYVNFDSFSVPPVTNLVIDQVHVSNGVVEYSKLAVSWNWSAGSTTLDYKPLFEISYRRDAQDFVQTKDLHTTNFDIEYPLPGVYEVYVWAVNPFSGIKSIVTTTISPYNYRVAAAVSSLLPPTSVVVPNTAGVAFTQPDLNLVWSYPAANDTKLDKLKDYVVQILDTATRTVKGTYVVAPNVNKGGDFILSFAENSTIFGTPQRNFIVRVFSRDLVGDLSNYVEVNPINAVPGVQSFSIFSGVSSVYLRITTTPENDIKGYLVWRAKTENFSLVPANVTTSAAVYDGADTYITLNVPDGSAYWYAVAAYDTFGKTGLNISSEQNSTPLSADATTWTKTGLQFTVDSVTPNKLNWTTGTIIRNGSFTYTIAAGTTTWTSGYVYVYFNPNVSQTTLQVTTTLLTAVSIGCYPIATYTGGSASNIKGGDGNAFISGSQIIAGTVGASEIKAGSITGDLIDISNAIIRNSAQITDGVITNAAIKDTIMSQNYNPTTHQGWKIDKAGDIVTYGSLGLYDTNGNVIFAGGNFNWNNAKGTGLPQVGATRNVFLGGWSSGYNYVVGDIVTDTLGYGWSCVTPHTSGGSVTTPIYPITSNSYWALYTVKGAKGDTGFTTATVYIYRRLAGANPPALPTARTTYTFSSAVLTGLDNNWSPTIPTGTDPLYVSTATANGSGLTDFIEASEWAAPALLAKNGVDGLPGVGTNGVNTATIPLYQTTTTSTPPTKPSVDLTYTFSNGNLVVTSSGLPPDPWKRSLPTTGAYRWITTATALGTGTTDSIPASEWSTVSLLAADGLSAAYVIVNGEQAFKYNKNSTTPTTASITLTAALYGGLNTYSWEYWSGAAWTPLSGTNTNSAYSLAYNNAAFTANSIRIRCASGGNYDEITVLKLYDGIDGVTTTNVINTTTTIVADTVTIAGEQAFNYPTGAANPPSNTTVTLAAYLTGSLNSYTWQYWNGSSWVNLSGTYTSSTYSLAYNNTAFTGNSLRIACWSGSKYDEITIVKLYSGVDGKSAVSGYITNETAALPADYLGTVSNYAICSGVFKVFDGVTDATTLTSPPTFSIPNATVSGMTMSINNSTGAYSYLSGALSTDTVTFTLRAVYKTITIDKVLVLTKSKSGLVGSDAVIGQLNYDTIAISCDSNGNPTGVSVTTVIMSVNKGGLDDSANWTYAVTLNNLISSTPTTSRTQTITNFGGGLTTREGYIEFTASRAGYSSIVKRCVFSKSIQGIAGAGTNYTGAADPTSTNPAAAINGDSYFNTVTQLMWVKIAGTWQKVIPQLTKGNATTFIASGAIGQLQVGSAAIGTAQIIDANVDTLKIAGNAVIVPYGATGTGTTAATLGEVQILTLTIAAETVPFTLMIDAGFGFKWSIANTAGSYVQVDYRVYINNVLQVSGPIGYSSALNQIAGGAGSTSFKFSAAANTVYTVSLRYVTAWTGSSTTRSILNPFIKAMTVKR